MTSTKLTATVDRLIILAGLGVNNHTYAARRSVYQVQKPTTLLFLMTMMGFLEEMMQRRLSRLIRARRHHRRHQHIGRHRHPHLLHHLGAARHP